ncbi:MAG: ATP citrate lyase citrate-binding domain-containing protein [Pseudomonadota bacterium]
MAQRGIREYDAKRMLATELPRFLGGKFAYEGKAALVKPDTDLDALAKALPWLAKTKLVVKPDQLFGKRGKHGLLLINADWDAARKWIGERMNKETSVGKVSGKLTHFLVEPFTPHDESEEFYVAIRDERERDIIYFSMKGGIFVEENWDKVVQIPVPINGDIEKIDISSSFKDLGDRREKVLAFVKALYKFYAENGFSYLEINPFTFSVDDDIVPLDLVAKVDDTAVFDCRKVWGDLEFPKAFGTASTKEEEYVKLLDEQSGASLKLTVLNPKGRVWTMVAGGGASVIYADTVCDLGAAKELANYGEYSGDPSTELTCNYAKTLLDLMTREKDPRGKVLLIGGGIANFTDVAKTFTGIIQALTEYRQKLIDNKVKIYVRRGGPNYKEGLAKMRKLGETLGVPIEVYGPETHMTKIVSLALKGVEPVPSPL